VTALVALLLDQDRVLDLDAPVNEYLARPLRGPAGRGWCPTLRHCLANLSGIASPPATWYSPGAELPPLPDVLAPLEVTERPGSTFRKSGGQWAVVQQVLTDVTAEPFAALAQRLVFDPLRLRDTSFTAPTGDAHASGHDEHGTPLAGGYRTRPVVAGAGLWSTAADLGQLAGEVRRAVRGDSDWLSPRLADDLLTESHPGSFYGLGTVVDRTRADTEVGHNGETPGYRALYVVRLGSGNGCVVLTNSDNGKDVHKSVTAELG
jgi:CubicO group peptidase (beta-lactamase class C family)